MITSSRLRRTLLLAAFVACAPACTRLTASRVVLATADSAPRAPSEPAKVTLFVGRAPRTPYVILGRVAVQSYKGEDPLLLLRAGAAQLGADGVIDVQLTRGPGSVQTRGIAIGLVSGAPTVP